jgi:predicted nucleic acid-binding protein
MIVDTNILIDYLKDKDKAIRFIELSPVPLGISVVSIAELHAGLRTNERERTARFLASFNTYRIDESIATSAGEFLHQYARSHNVGLGDALIAATSRMHNDQLATLNIKHFPMLSDVIRPY